MRNVRIPGATENVGAKQGYVGISVKVEREVATIGGQDREVTVCKMMYELTSDERRALLEGGRIVLTMLSTVVIPHRLEVQDV
jgi:hypothetical protein